MDANECIKKLIKWQDLPVSIKSNFGNDSKKWEEYIVQFSISNQLSYKSNLVNTLINKEERYYRMTIQHSCTNLMIYPYHIQSRIIRLLNITPYTYYCNMLSEQVAKEKSYDSIPNFTAADCLQLLSIGRNQYIDIVMQSRSNRTWGIRKSNIKHMLPKKPNAWTCLEPWWYFNVGCIMVTDINNCSAIEKSVIDEVIDKHGQPCGYYDRDVIISLYSKNLIFFDVPVMDGDYFVVPKLENFVMNRVQGDYLESMMYKVFVSLDENTCLKELAKLLDIDLELVKQAVSVFCRLGMVNKKKIEIEINKIHSSWANLLSSTVNWSNRSESSKKLQIDTSSIITKEIISPTPPVKMNPFSIDDPASDQSTKRIAFIYDSTLSAFLMMGNLSQALKVYAMTMFEIGKITHEMMDDFLEELSKIQLVDEGDAIRYYTHAVNLFSTIKFLRQDASLISNCLPRNNNSPPALVPVDMIHNESLKNLSRKTVLKMFEQRYIILISMSPLSSAISPPCCSDPPFFGPFLTEVNTFWFRLFVYYKLKLGPPTLFLPHGVRLTVIPKIFTGFELLFVATPEQHPSIYPIGNCLPSINESLKFSSVLVQGFTCDTEVSNKLFYLTFPIKEEILQSDNISKRMKLFLNDLISKFNLQHGFGYISLLKTEKNKNLVKRDSLLSECINTSTIPSSLINDGILLNEDHVFDDITDRWIDAPIFDNITIIDKNNYIEHFNPNTNFRLNPFEIFYGIPLFSNHLNQLVCQGIQTNKLLYKENTKIFVRENRKLVLSFMDFIHSFGGSYFKNYQSSSSNTLQNIMLYKPTKPLQFSDGQVSFWSIQNEI